MTTISVCGLLSRTSLMYFGVRTYTCRCYSTRSTHGIFPLNLPFLVATSATAVARPGTHCVRLDDALQTAGTWHLDTGLGETLHAAATSHSTGTVTTMGGWCLNRPTGDAAPHAVANARLQDRFAAARRRRVRTAADAEAVRWEAKDVTGTLTVLTVKFTLSDALEARLKVRAFLLGRSWESALESWVDTEPWVDVVVAAVVVLPLVSTTFCRLAFR